MGIFQQFPYTNFHEMNLDAIINIMQQIEKEWEATKTEWNSYKDFIDNYFNDLDLTDEVMDALRIMIEDGSLYPILDYVLPEMFGAVCDGVTDDASALQDCIDFAAVHSVPVKITKDILVNSTITVPSYVRIDGSTNYEYYPYVIAGPGCQTVFNCTGVCNIFKNFGIRNYEDSYRLLTGIILSGDANYNVDSEIDNMYIRLMDTGVIAKGRNVNIHNSFFGQSRIGIYFDLPSAGTQYRGLQVENCRFHEIGSFADLNWFENSRCIHIQENVGSNLTIRNCIADQSGTFFYGYCTNGIIENNFVESYKKPIIDISGVGLPANVGNLMITGNSFNGKSGTVLPGVPIDNPEHIIKITNSGRINIDGNTIRNSKYEMVSLDTISQSSIGTNIFLNAGIDDANRRTAILLDGATYAYIANNVSETGSMQLLSADSASIVTIDTNSNFIINESLSNLTLVDNKKWILIGTCASNSPLPFALPKEFMVRANDGRTCFNCTAYGDYISNGISFAQNGLSFNALTFAKISDDYYPIMRNYQVSDLTNPTASSATLYFYTLEN